MKAGRSTKKRKRSTKPKFILGEKELEFRGILHGNKSGLEVSLVHRIAVAQSLSPPPIVYDLDWNPQPKKCINKGAIAILACASSYGAHLYYLPKSTKSWTTMLMKNRPTRQGDCIRWHHSGTTFATTSNPTDKKASMITIFTYDSTTLCFDDTSRFDIGQRKVTSLAWVFGTDILVAAIFPSSALYFFKLKEGSVEVVQKAKCAGFPSNSPIVLQPDTSFTSFFAACLEATKILVWNKDQDNDIWTIIRSVDCGEGICGMDFEKSTNSLFTTQKGYWKVWHFDQQMDLKLKFTSVNEHKIVKGKTLKYRSELISLGCSSNGKFVATGGTGDTFLVYVMPAKPTDDALAVHWNPGFWRNSDFCYGEVRCIKFNPKDDLNLRIATGGNNGFIHFWSLKYARGKGNMDIPGRRYEREYYSNHLRPENIRIPSTSDNDDEEEEEGDDDGDDDDEEEEVNTGVVREGRFEVVVEYEDKEVRKGIDLEQYQIKADARAILNIINRGDDVPKEQIKALCEKITSADND